MSRYIDADKLYELIRTNDYKLATKNGSIDYGMFTVGIKQAIDEQPTADVAEVRHGKWIDYVEKISGKIQITCSQCGRFLYVYLPYNFCPNCGARMDGETNDG